MHKYLCTISRRKFFYFLSGKLHHIDSMTPVTRMHKFVQVCCTCSNWVPSIFFIIFCYKRCHFWLNFTGWWICISFIWWASFCRFIGFLIRWIAIFFVWIFLSDKTYKWNWFSRSVRSCIKTWVKARFRQSIVVVAEFFLQGVCCNSCVEFIAEIRLTCLCIINYRLNLL